MFVNLLILMLFSVNISQVNNKIFSYKSTQRDDVLFHQKKLQTYYILLIEIHNWKNNCKWISMTYFQFPHYPLKTLINISIRAPPDSLRTTTLFLFDVMEFYHFTKQHTSRHTLYTYTANPFFSFFFILSPKTLSVLRNTSLNAPTHLYQETNTKEFSHSTFYLEKCVKYRKSRRQYKINITMMNIIEVELCRMKVHWKWD